jgi:hypothetical protein
MHAPQTKAIAHIFVSQSLKLSVYASVLQVTRQILMILQNVLVSNLLLWHNFSFMVRGKAPFAHSVRGSPGQRNKCKDEWLFVVLNSVLLDSILKLRLL